VQGGGEAEHAVKKQSTEPRRPVLALILLAAAIFLTFGNQAGALGQHLAGFADYYVGHLGVALIVLTLLSIAYVLGVPAGTATKIANLIRAWQQATPAPSRILVEKALLPTALALDHRKADDVRSAMKSLGYFKREYDPVLVGLDMSLPVEKLVRAAICILHKQKEASRPS
jgi:hypothetical protein